MTPQEERPFDRAMAEFADDLERVAADCTVDGIDILVAAAIITFVLTLLILR